MTDTTDINVAIEQDPEHGPIFTLDVANLDSAVPQLERIRHLVDAAIRAARHEPGLLRREDGRFEGLTILQREIDRPQR